MKRKTTLWINLLLIVLLLAACSGAAQTTAETVASELGQTTQAGAPTDPSRLALGILALENGGPPLSQEQAVELLLLWKAYDALQSSDSVAQQELDALLVQIQDTLSAEQQAAISAIDLGSVDLVQIAQQLGISLPPEGMGGGFGAGGLSEEQRAAMQAARESGQFPGGEMGPGGGIGPGGMGGGFPGGNMPPPDSEFSGGRMPEAAQTQAASGPRLVPEASMGINPGLLVVVIQFLEQRANQDR